MKDLQKLSKHELIKEIEYLRRGSEIEPGNFNSGLLLTIVENYPNSYISIIEKDLTTGFSSGQEFKNQNLDPEDFSGLSLEQIFGEHTPFIKEHYLKTFAGEEQSFELFINGQYQLYKTVPLENKDGSIDRILSVVENITAKKEASILLEESEERFHQLFEKHNAVMLLIEPETGKIIDANLSAQNFYGYPDETLKQMTIQDINSLPEDKMLELRKQAQKEDQNYFVFPHRLASGELRTVEVHSSPIIINKKQILFSIIHDITKRNQAEQDLQESKVFNETLLNSSPDIIYIYDIVTNKNIYINDGIMKILGYTTVEIKKMGNQIISQLMHPDDFKIYLEETYPQYQLLKDRERHTHEYRMKHKSGDWYWLLSRESIFLRDTAGNPLQVFGIMSDITERKKAEKELLESKEKLKLIIDTSPIGICTVDGLGQFTTTNLAYEQMIGYSKEECRDLSLFDVTQPSDRPKNKKLFQSMFSMETSGFSMEKKYIRKNGEKIDVAIHAIGITDLNGNIRFGTAFVEDITERKLIEQANYLSNKRYKSLFNNSPIPLWEENFTDLASYLSELKEKGHKDLRNYFENNPNELVKCAGMIKILDINQAALDLHKAKSKEQLIVNLSEIFTKNSYTVFMNELVALDEGKEIFESESEVKTLLGDLKNIYITLKIDQSKPDNVKALLATTDITERKRAEEELRANHARHAAMITNISDVIAIIGTDGMIKYQSPNIEKWFGWEPEDLIGTNGWDKIHPEDIERVKKEFSKILEHNNASTVEYRFKCKDGNYKWIELTAVNRLNNPAINGVLINYHDITDRKQDEESMRKQKDMFELVINSVPTRIFWKDINSAYLGCNISFLEAVRKNKIEDVIGKNDFDLIWAKEAEKYINDDRQVIKTGIPKLEYEEYYTLPDGKKTWWRTSKMPLKNTTGKIIGILATSEDVTEHKQFLKILQERNEYIESIMENMPVGFAVNTIDDGDVKYMNKLFEDIYGWSKDILSNTSIFFDKIFPDPEYHKKMKAQIIADMQSGDPERMHWKDLKIVTNTGEKRYVLASNIPLLKQNLMISTVQDTTKHKLAENEILKHQKHLEELVKERTINLEEKNKELERFNNIFIDREFRIKELREKVKELEKD